MSYLYISVYADAKSIALGYPLAKARVDFSGGEATSAAFSANNGNPMVARITCDVNCQFERGTSPSIGNTSEPLWATQVEHVWINDGDKFAVDDVQA